MLKVWSYKNKINKIVVWFIVVIVACIRLNDFQALFWMVLDASGTLAQKPNLVFTRLTNGQKSNIYLYIDIYSPFIFIIYTVVVSDHFSTDQRGPELVFLFYFQKCVKAI